MEYLIEFLTALAVTLVGGLILYHIFGVGKSNKNKDKINEPFKLKFAEEEVTFEEKLRSLKVDVIKINAHDHTLGIRSEYVWISENYPGSRTGTQYLMGKEFKAKNRKKRVVSFDVIDVMLADGREKQVYFEIDSFFGEGKAASFEPGFIDGKLNDIYAT